MKIRSHFVSILAGASLGTTNYVRAEGHIPSSIFMLIGNGILGYMIVGLLIMLVIVLASIISDKEYKGAVFEDALVIASCTIVVMCLGFLFLQYSAY